MSGVEPVPIVSPRPRRRRVGVVLLFLGCAMFLAAAVMMAVIFVPAFSQSMTSTRYRLPMNTTIPLKAGSWMVFEQTGTSRQNGPITFTMNGSPSLTAAEVMVTDSSGSSVATYEPWATETLTRNDEIYTAVAAFDAPASGLFTVKASGAAGVPVVIAPSLDALFATAAMWFLLLAAGVAVGILGLVLVLSGRARRQSESFVFAPPWTVRQARGRSGPGAA